MIRINLAPPVARPRRGRLSPVALGATSLAVLGGLGWWYVALTHGETHLIEHVAILNRELTTLHAMLGRGAGAREVMSDLTRRTQAIHELTRGQGTAMRILDSALDEVPPDLWLTALEGRGLELRAVGSARSTRAVADFTANLRASGTFKDVEIVMSKQDLGRTPPGPVSFEVTCRFGP